MKNISILGSTGSIGVNTLKVIESLGDGYRVVGLAARENISLILKQIKKFHPLAVALTDEEAAEKLRKQISGLKVKVYSGLDGIKKIATLPEANLVVSSIVGAAGLIPTLEAIKQHKTIALANKELLVMAGEIVTREALAKKVTILPVDSEHNAIFQCLKNEDIGSVNKLILTASGGPFYKFNSRKLGNVTPSQALNHPTWNMGKKITVDSATLLNKGFEIIEASYLFAIDVRRIEVLIHFQSTVHSMVEFIDGSILAQLGVTDMRLPIQYALSYPVRQPRIVPNLSFDKVSRLDFSKPDFKKFPLLKVAREVAISGGTLPAVLNGADEIAVEAFLAGRIKFPDIYEFIRRVLDRHKIIKNPSLEDILEADRWARVITKEEVCSRR
jgi:1-deoxy-D-xylulose-5-phosphate reductoisomerase